MQRRDAGVRACRSVSASCEHGTHKTVKARYKTVRTRYKTVKARTYKTVKARGLVAEEGRGRARVQERLGILHKYKTVSNAHIRKSATHI